MGEPVIDLNADVAEGAGDAALYALVTSVNIACGAHAGSEDLMRGAIALAQRHGVAIGAHPGYADPESMGRRPLTLSPYEVERLVVGQVTMLAKIAAAAGMRLRHVKPHGALYNQAATDASLARAIAAAVAAVDPALTLVGLAGSELPAAGRAAGLATANEAFCDRGYRFDGTLIPRTDAGALIEDPSHAAAQAVAIARGEPVATAGGLLRIRAETLCLHADTPGAVARAAAVRAALDAAGITVVAL